MDEMRGTGPGVLKAVPDDLQKEVARGVQGALARIVHETGAAPMVGAA